MTEFKSLTGDVPLIPDNMSVVQFLLDYEHPIRPKRPEGSPWLIVDGTGREIGKEELLKRTASLASSLRSTFGLGENDVVALFSSNHVDYPVCIWAVHRLLGIVSLANPAYTPQELAHLFRQTRPSVIIAHIDVLDTAEAAARLVGIPLNRIAVLEDQDSQENDNTIRVPQVSPETLTIQDLVNMGSRQPVSTGRPLAPGEGQQKIAFFCSSSGTTGTPKVVALSHYGTLAIFIQTAAHNRLGQNYVAWQDQRYRAGDSCIAVLPFYHIYGLNVVLNFVLFCGMTLVVVPKFQFTGFLESIQTYRITHLMVVPPQVLLMCKEPITKKYNLSSIRVLLCAGSSLTDELKGQLYQILPHAQIGQAYGSTETGIVSTWPINQVRGLCEGELIPGVTVRLIKADGSFAGYDEPGELRVKTPSAAMGYYGSEQATTETFVDGWIHSGDLVKINRNHEVIFIERLKEIMKVRGFQVAPAEIEGCILDHPWVADVGVVAISDEYSGDLPLAFVVPKIDILAREDPAQIKAAIMEHVAHNKAPFKRLVRVELIEAVPKNASGKILRRVLRKRLKELNLTKTHINSSKL